MRVAQSIVESRIAFLPVGLISDPDQNDAVQLTYVSLPMLEMTFSSASCEPSTEGFTL
jgi:hypothetical protein